MAIETGLSDYHKMTVTVMKKHYKKLEPIKIQYRCYKTFDGNLFRQELRQKLTNLENLELENFKKF